MRTEFWNYSMRFSLYISKWMIYCIYVVWKHTWAVQMRLASLRYYLRDKDTAMPRLVPLFSERQHTMRHCYETPSTSPSPSRCHCIYFVFDSVVIVKFNYLWAERINSLHIFSYPSLYDNDSKELFKPYSLGFLHNKFDICSSIFQIFIKPVKMYITLKWNATVSG